jgi:hypothetical protein
MKKLNFLIVFILLACVAIGQEKLNVKVPWADNAPTIDGIEEEIWDKVPAVPIDSIYIFEQPSVTAYWKALWDGTYIYVLLNVEDDDHWPAWEKAGGQWFMYDQPELYFDVNEILEDGAGGGQGGTGHYQVQPPFVDGGSGKKESLIQLSYRPGGEYCYVLSGEDYVFEYAIDASTMMNKDNVTMSTGALQALDSVGFDVYIIDQDEGVTTTRHRAVWSNTGRINENYNNMDDAGTITLVDVIESSVNSVKRRPNSLSVYPNPAHDYITINAEFDKLIISDILGKEMMTITNSDNRINIESLTRGIYFIQVLNNGNSLGVAKIHKM